MATPAPKPAFEFPPAQSVGYLLRDTHRAFSKLLQLRIAHEGVTMGMWFFLRALWEEEGPTQRELSRRIGMVESTTVPALEQLERRGLIRRQRDAADRRRSRVFLTARGRALKHVLLPAAFETNQAALEGIAEPDIEHLKRTLRLIRDNLERRLQEPESAD